MFKIGAGAAEEHPRSPQPGKVQKYEGGETVAKRAADHRTQKYQQLKDHLMLSAIIYYLWVMK